MLKHVLKQAGDERKHYPLKACTIVWSIFETDSRVRKYVDSLLEIGFSVDVISLSGKNHKSWPNIYRYKNNAKIYEVGIRSQELRKFDYIKSFCKFFIFSAFLSSKLQLKNKYKIVHVHTPPDFQVFSVFLHKLMGTKIILDVHDPFPDFFISKFGKRRNYFFIKLLLLIERMSIAFSDHVITVTDYWRKTICKRSFVNESKLSVITNFPDTSLFNPTKHSADPDKKEFVMLYPGTINKHCGLDIALKAVSLIKDKVSSFRFDIYGKGSEYEKIKVLAANFGIEDIVCFYDHIPLVNVPDLMAKADIGIALLAGNDIYSKQALNVKLFEYISMGLPSIATETEATKYYLSDKLVVFSKQNDPVDVAKCIYKLYNDEQIREEIKINCLNSSIFLSWNSQKNIFKSIISKTIFKNE